MFSNASLSRLRTRALASAIALLAVFASFGSAPAPARAGSPTPWPGGVWSPDPVQYGDTTVQNVNITMSDGVNLVGDVEYPTSLSTGQRAAGTFPVLLTQNPYVCQFPVNNSNSFFVSRGYIFATVCVRGTGRSGGSFGFFSHRDALDGVELVNWAAHLDGSNGIVGGTGCSYLGITQIFTAGLVGPNSPLKEISPFCAGSEIYRESNTAWGVPTESFVYQFPGILGLIGPQAGAFGAALNAEVFSGGDRAYYHDFWKERTQDQYVTQIIQNNIPALFWSGWNDIFTGTSHQMYAYLQNAYFGRPTYGPMQPGQPVTGRYQIVIGPWGHGAGIDQNIELEWYDTWLKGQATRMADTQTPMHLWDSSRQGWINAATYPEFATYTPYYLGKGGKLTTTAPSGATADTLSYVQPSAPGGSLTYTSDAFPNGVTLAGPMSGTFYASSTGTDLEIIAEVDDLAPDGTTVVIGNHGNITGWFPTLAPGRTWTDTQGVLTLPYGLFDAAVPMTPGQVTRFDFSIRPQVMTLAPGHRIRLTLTTQEVPASCVGILGTDPCFPTAPQAVSLTGTSYSISEGGTAASRVNLPLAPYGVYPITGTGAIPTDWGQGPPPASSDSGAGVAGSAANAATGPAVTALPFSAGPGHGLPVGALVVLLLGAGVIAAGAAGRLRRPLR